MFAIHKRGTSPDQKVFRHRSRVSKGTTEFYAERGLITIRWEGDDGLEHFERVSLQEFRCRACALAEEIAHFKYDDEKLDQKRLVETMVHVFHEAVRQLGRILANPATRVAVPGGADYSYAPAVAAVPAPPPDKPAVPLD